VLVLVSRSETSTIYFKRQEHQVTIQEKKSEITKKQLITKENDKEAKHINK
jgi:hypothetical protein